ncbi:WecB/TagA/CpsF family glycosyltransferase [Sediminibacterium soli]|uniref:WecB/TagA/CpsF family glycosyltransferase n=1 Tax=Sediminibacterium soli TaxID=2698829 RepID=UPI00137B6B3D|nr:WecB/TagA/CpsF family glycosyltransferase [Sediminibacterium soli]NCI48054.1 WecB/TagA/CpsF family glycosyltransferase [Sediminibacterium soli]
MNEQVAPKVNIAGTGISNVTLEETLGLFDEWIRNGSKKRVCVTPVNCVVWADANRELQHIYNTADLTLCDGVPLIWASKWLGQTSLRGRVTGLDLLPAFVDHCYQKGYSMFFLGSAPETNTLLKKKLDTAYPGIRVAGMYSPPFAKTFSDAENEKILALINQAKPDIVWVSLTAPKQDYWIYGMFEHMNTHIAVGIGGALDVLAGNIARAPRWMQKNGLEWLFRFCKEPKRLFRRYFVEAPRIIPLILRQKTALKHPER